MTTRPGPWLRVTSPISACAASLPLVGQLRHSTEVMGVFGQNGLHTGFQIVRKLAVDWAPCPADELIHLPDVGHGAPVWAGDVDDGVGGGKGFLL